jgi:hypothetical protein
MLLRGRRDERVLDSAALLERDERSVTGAPRERR